MINKNACTKWVQFNIENASARPPHPEEGVTAGGIAQSICWNWFKNFARVLRRFSCGCGFSQGVAQDFLHDFCHCFCNVFSREKSSRMPPETLREGPRSIPGASQNGPRTSPDRLAEQLQKNNAKNADHPLEIWYFWAHFGTRPEPQNRTKTSPEPKKCVRRRRR